jgi:Xaa-Pro aminopeptidase
MPTERPFQSGELVLIDAAAEVRRYLCDVTRTFAVTGSFSGFQKEVYDVVLHAEKRAIARCRAGTEYRDVHLGAARDIAEGLVRLGLLRGDVDTLVERDVHALFFPHGIGHMVGFGVRDATGYLPGRQPSPRPGLAALRTDLPLQPGYVLTIEPGIYFVPALLGDSKRRETYRDAVAWDRVDRLMDFGGVRIEDNVLVTAGEPEVLTASIPR